MSPSREYLPTQSRNTVIIVACVAGSLLVHGVAYGVLYEIPEPAVKARTSEDIVRRKEPEKKKPKKYRVKLRPRPRPIPKRAVVKKKTAKAKVVRKFRPMAPPPMAAEPPRPRARPVLDLTMGAGVNQSLTNANGDFALQTGDTAQGDPTVPYKPGVRGPMRPPPMRRPPPPPPMRARPVPVYVKVLPRVVTVPRVPYPAAAKRMQIEGTVRLSVTVGRTGRVLRVKVLKRLGYGLDEAAMRALKLARFKPAYGSDGRPMVYTIRYRYTFRMER